MNHDTEAENDERRPTRGCDLRLTVKITSRKAKGFDSLRHKGNRIDRVSIFISSSGSNSVRHLNNCWLDAVLFLRCNLYAVVKLHKKCIFLSYAVSVTLLKSLTVMR